MLFDFRLVLPHQVTEENLQDTVQIWPKLSILLFSMSTVMIQRLWWLWPKLHWNTNRDSPKKFLWNFIVSDDGVIMNWTIRHLPILYYINKFIIGTLVHYVQNYMMGKKLKIDCVVPKLYYKNIKISFRIGTQTLVLM